MSIWGPWMDHDGESCPVFAGAASVTHHADDSTHTGSASDLSQIGWFWEACLAIGKPELRILRYRVLRHCFLKNSDLAPLEPIAADRAITTRRAIEVCLARLPMHRDTRETLVRHLSNEITSGGSAEAAGDVEALRAALVSIQDAVSGVSDFPRTALLARISIASDIAGKALS